MINNNRAIDGDTVVVEVLREESHSSFAVSVDNSQGGDAQVGSDTAEASVAGVEGLPYSAVPSTSDGGKVRVDGGDAGDRKGRVVSVLKKTWRQFAGSLSKADANTDVVLDTTYSMSGSSSSIEDEGLSAALFVPVDRKVPCIRIFTRRLGALLGQRVLVAVDHWPAESLFPIGHYVRSLGCENDKEVETKVHDTHCVYTHLMYVCMYGISCA